MSRQHRILRASCTLLAVLAFAAGCSDTCTCPDDTGYPDQSTPDNVIEKLEMAYEAMDTDAYMECLAEDFVFFLNPGIVAADMALPEYWDKQEEEVFHRHMFADTTIVESILATISFSSRMCHQTGSLCTATPGGM